MKIAVIDDERPARNELKQQILDYWPDAEIEEGDCGAAALEIAVGTKFDIIFLDINLGDVPGTVLVNALKKMQPSASIVFVTAYSDYAVQAFELEVEDYILKPFKPSRLQKVLDKCKNKMTAAPSSPIEIPEEQKSDHEAKKRMAINTSGKTVIEDIKHIVFIETYNRGCMVHTIHGDYQDSRSIGEMERKLVGTRFYRIHKSYIVNLDEVREVFPWGNNSFSLRMKKFDDILPISREKTKELRKFLES